VLTNNDPRLAIIKNVIQSADGIKAMVLATSKGCPTLGGVDKLLCAAPGAEYVSDGAVRQEAGWRVAQEMKEMGFVEVGHADMPSGCGAAKGLVFRFPVT
jgi:hypothetical protein